MNPDLELLCQSRAELLTKSLTRHRLVFVQLGCVFEPLRDGIVHRVGHETTVDQRSTWRDLDATTSTLVVTDLESCATSERNVLGEVREQVFSALDSGRAVCLMSRTPRIAFQSVPGSSILEDSALVTLPLLSRDELGLEPDEYPPTGWRFPRVVFGEPFGPETYEPILGELGQGLVASLDHALFEVNPKGPDGLGFLSSRELEGLRGGGILEIDREGDPALSEPGSIKLLREAVATYISAAVLPAEILPTVSSGLWFIERRIRSQVRSEAIRRFGAGWRASCVGGLNAEVLRRAQLDTNVAAKAITDLRDPLEWLTLGELMDLVRSDKFDNLGIEPAIWRKLQEQLVPVRNRIAHVRMLKSGDDETVSMWASLIKSRFGQ